mmetsp:Transcript_23686/g.35543  ORF Transcript_23686/g.35543 Transcript_23686/m.35543 type:complete len:370 (-) Transcript_23686:70-1179(-)
MGACASADGKAAKDKILMQQLKNDLQEMKTEHKLLLLGAGGCGKSTIMKQMKTIHNTKFTPEEIKEFAEIIRDNLLTSLNMMAQAIDDLCLTEQKEGRALREYFQSIGSHIKSISISGLEEGPRKEMVSKISSFWKDETTQKAYIRGNEYNLLESTQFYLDTIGPEAILRPDYVPSHEEIVRSRRATEAITEYKFTLKTNGTEHGQSAPKITLVDVGGQRTRRKKWIRCFDKVTLILFVASLSEYDMKLEEDPTRNRMFESLELFDGIREMKWFKNTPVILFLNKWDVFKEKIKRSEENFALPFEDYTGGKDPEKAFEYIKTAFSQDEEELFVFKTIAVEKDNIDKVWSSVKIVVMRKNMTIFGMISEQ